MNTRWKIALASTVSAAVAAVAAVVLAGGSADRATATVPPDTTEATEEELERTISVSGHGTVEVVPDTAQIWLGVEATAPTGDEVMATIDEKSNALVESLKRLGIAERDIQTSGLSLYPNYKQDGRTINGYNASVNVTVTSHDLDRLGELLDGVQGRVGNELTIGGISFSYEDPEVVMEQARVAAIENARARAAQYASAAGAEVGTIVKIAEMTAAAPPVPYAADLAAERSVAIEPGSQELAVDVTVVFEMT